MGTLPSLAQVGKPVWVNKVITWKDVPNAEFYCVRLYDEDLQVLDTQRVAKGIQRYDFTDLIENYLPAGRYYCTVQALGQDAYNWQTPVTILDLETDVSRPSNWVATEDGKILLAYYDAVQGHMRLSSVMEADIWAGTADIAGNSWLVYVPAGDSNITFLKMPDKSILMFIWDGGTAPPSTSTTKVYRSADGMGRFWSLLSTIATVPISYNGGTKFVGIPLLLPSGRIVVTFPGPYKWFGYYDTTGLYVATSDDEGASWSTTFLTSPGVPETPYAKGLMYFNSPGGSQLIIGLHFDGGGASYYRFIYSLDEGTTWHHIEDGQSKLNLTDKISRSYMHDSYTNVLYGGDGYNYYRRWGHEPLLGLPGALFRYKVFRRPQNQLLPLDGQSPFDETVTWESISDWTRVGYGSNMFFMSPAGYITWVEGGYGGYPSDGNLWAIHATRDRPGLESDFSNPLVVRAFILNMETPTGDGSVVPDVGQHTYMEGTVVILVASPAAGSKFKTWQGDEVEDQDNKFTRIVMDDDKSIKAIFEETVELTIVATGGGSTIPPAGNVIQVAKNEVITLKAVPNDGFEFQGWSGDITDTADTIHLTMDADKLVGATFAEQETEATNNKKLYYATVNERAFWNIDGKWTFFASPRHSQLKELNQDNHPQYHNDARGDLRYYTKAEIDEMVGGKPLATEVAFVNQAVWTVEHNLGRLPVMAIWEETASAIVFGSQPFGTSPFGGAAAILAENTKTPTITQQGLNTTIITWESAKTGKVVYI